MSYFILSNLPYLIVFFVGIVMALNRREAQPQLASWALVCYGTLLASGLMQIFMVVGLSRADIGGEDSDLLLMRLGHVRMVVHYLTILALMVGAFLWRKDTEDPYGKPGMFVGLCVVLMILEFIIVRSSVVPPQIWSFLIFGCEMGAYIALMAAFFGWRDKQYVGESPAVPTPAPIPGENPQPVPAATGMFEEKDYIPFVMGIIIFAGLGVIPVLWGKFTETGYVPALLPSLLSCGIFIYAHDKRGNFSFLNFFLGFFFVAMIVLRSTVQSSRRNGGSFFWAGGVLGYIVMLACGWAGIMIARSLRR